MGKVYVKRIVNADITRQIDLSLAGSEFFHYDISKMTAPLSLTFKGKVSGKVYDGEIKKSGHGVTITGGLFKHVKDNHHFGDILVVEQTKDPKTFVFQVFEPGSVLYDKYFEVLEKFGVYSSRLRLYTHLVIDAGQLPFAVKDPWTKALEDWEAKIDTLDEDEVNTSESVVRELHAEWKNMLAMEMMNLVKKDTSVVCPFTDITGDFKKVPMLYIASHIKRFANSSIREKYDINNGLLLTANADALFDKYMISVSENKELLFSCLIEKDLKEELLLTHGIMKPILTDKRMEYMKEHRKIFYEKEAERRMEDIFEGENDINSETTGQIIAPTLEYLNSIADKQKTDIAIATAAEEETFADIERNSFKNGISLPNTVILVGCYKNVKHNKWIFQHKLYNIRLGRRKGSCKDRVPQATILILYQNNCLKDYKAYSLGSGRELTGTEMTELEYPTKNPGKSYYVFEIKDEIDAKYDLQRIMAIAKAELGEDYHNGMPIFIV